MVSYKILRIVVLFLGVLPLLSAKCDKSSEFCHTRIYFNNESDTDLYIDYSHLYPDTMPYLSADALLSNVVTRSTPRRSVNDLALRASIHRPNRTCWENVMSDAKNFPSDTMIVFVYDAERINNMKAVNRKIAWEKEMILQRYYPSLADLQRVDFKLSYPPTEAMKKIKMYPPYPVAKD